MDAETDEVPVRSFKVSRNRQGKLFLDGIKEGLGNRGRVLLGIGTVGQPAHKEGWTIKTYNTTPVQLIVGPKPGMDTMYGSGGCVCQDYTCDDDPHRKVLNLQSAYIQHAQHPALLYCRLFLQLSKCPKRPSQGCHQLPK